MASGRIAAESRWLRMDVFAAHAEFFFAFLLLGIGLFRAIHGVATRQRRAVLIGLGCLLLGSLSMAKQDYSVFWLVDGCLDSGGRYDYDAQSCEYR